MRTCFVSRPNSRSMAARIISSGSTSGMTSRSVPANSRTRLAKAVASLPQERPDHVLDGAHFVQHRAAGSPETALPALDMHLSIPAGAHDLRQRAGIIRSVLFGIVFIAALACRVSMQMAGRPSAHIPS